MTERKKHSKVVSPDEIEFVDEHRSLGAEVEGLAELEDVRRFCNRRPWVRIFALLLFWIMTLIGGCLLLCCLGAFVLAAAGLFNNHKWNAWLTKAWTLLCYATAALVALFVGIVSPVFGLGIIGFYVFFLKPLPSAQVWIKNLHSHSR